jgi:hypothetical protein
MLQRAQELFRMLPAKYRTRGARNVLAPAELNTSELKQLREDTFGYHEKRRVLLETAKQCSHQRRTLGESSTRKFLETYSLDQQTLLRKVYCRLQNRGSKDCVITD